MGSADVSKALLSDYHDVGQLLLAQPEDQWFERKSARTAPRKLAEALVGFANADGGVVIVGLSAGVVEGTRGDIRHRNELMQTALQYTEPVVKAKPHLRTCVTTDGLADDLLVFEIPPSRTVHATTRDEVFLRVGDETRRLSFNARRELLYDKSQSGFETELTSVSVDHADVALLASYAGRLGAPDPIRLLAARGLIEAGYLTMAGVLLFAAQPGATLPNAHIRICRFGGRQRGLGSRQQLQEDVRIESPIPRALNQAREVIQRLQPRRRALTAGGTFDDIGIVPEDAWLEGLVNAAVHRSYSLGGDHIHVDIFDDRIEIESPGRFPGLVDLTDPVRTTRYARNPRIARVCADLRIGQEFGEGIRRMFEEMRLAGLDEPMYHQTSGSVQLTLSGEPADRVLQERLPRETRLITGALKEAGQMSTGEVAELLGTARPTAIRRLQQLRDLGMVEWVGKSSSDPRAFWRLSR